MSIDYTTGNGTKDSFSALEGGIQLAERYAENSDLIQTSNNDNSGIKSSLTKIRDTDYETFKSSLDAQLKVMKDLEDTVKNGTWKG